MLAFFRGLLIPDDQRGDPYAWACVALAHAMAIGVTLGMILLAALVPPLWVPAVVALAYGIGWEWGVQRSPLGDGLVDTAAVACGAGVIASPDLMTAATCQALLLLFVLFGVWRRS